MHFPYFAAPETDLSDFVGEAQCRLCGRTAPAFSLRFATVPELSEAERESAAGCWECLAEGRFAFSHDPESVDVRPEALAALGRTPQFTSWQSPVWLAHCGDFMVYEGTWNPDDFRRHASDGDGRALFLAMTAEMDHLWDESDADHESEWHATYYVFRCRHCGSRRGNWDCP